MVAESVVGATTLHEDGFGYSLFEPTAHRFTALLPAAAVDGTASRLLRRAIEAQKPAHTETHLCLMEPHMRIGIQSRLGVDAIIAGPAAPSPIDTGQALDRTLHLADDAADAPGAVQRRARIGIDTRLA